MDDAMALAGDGLAVVAAVARGRTGEANNGLDLVAPPLPRAVVDAAACYDLFCHQYDVLPRLFGVGKGDTAAALRLLLHPPPPESLQQQPSSDGNRNQSASAPAETVSSRSSMGAAKERRDARSRKLLASALSQYGLLGRVHMLYAIAPDSVSCPPTLRACPFPSDF